MIKSGTWLVFFNNPGWIFKRSAESVNWTGLMLPHFEFCFVRTFLLVTQVCQGWLYSFACNSSLTGMVIFLAWCLDVFGRTIYKRFRSDGEYCSQITRGRGRHGTTRRETVKKDLEINELDRDVIYGRTLWRRLIHSQLHLVGIRLGCCCCFIHKKSELLSYYFLNKRNLDGDMHIMD